MRLYHTNLLLIGGGQLSMRLIINIVVAETCGLACWKIFPGTSFLDRLYTTINASLKIVRHLLSDFDTGVLLFEMS
jgi:hypothetical protein